MNSQQEFKPPAASNLSAPIDAGFTRSVKRYLSAWPNSTAPDAFFVPPAPSDSVNCPLCAATFSTDALLRSHISTSHPNAYNPAPVHPPLHPPFPAAPPVLPALSSLPAPTFPPAGPTFPHDSWLRIPSGPLCGAPTPAPAPQPAPAPSPQSAFPLQRSGDVRSPVRNRNLFCTVCDVQCDTAVQLAKHQAGQKHTRKLEIHRTFAEASKTFEQEGLVQLAVDVWTCTHCNTHVQGKSPVMQHLEATKHKKNRDAVVGNDPNGRKRTRPPRIVVTSPVSTGNGDSASPLNGIKELAVGKGASASAVHGQGKRLPPLQKPAGNPGVIGDKHPQRSLLSVLTVVEATNGATGPASQLLGSLPSPLRGSSIDEKTTPPTMDPLRSPASCMSIGSPSHLLPPNHGVRLPSSTPVTEFSCVVCNVSCNSMDSLNAHLASAKHRRKQTLQETRQTGSISPGNQDQVAADGTLHCEVCNISCCGPENFQSHLRGKPHAKRVRLNASHAKTY